MQLFCHQMQSFLGGIANVLQENAKFLSGTQMFCGSMQMFREITQFLGGMQCDTSVKCKVSPVNVNVL